MSNQQQLSPGVQALQAVLQAEFAKFLAQPAIQELTRNLLNGFERLETRLEELEQRQGMVEQALTLNLKQVVELRKGMEPQQRDDWWRGEAEEGDE